MKQKYVPIIAGGILGVILAAMALYYVFPDTTYGLMLKAERYRSGLVQRGVYAGGVHFEFIEGGSGETILAIHGFGTDKDNWTRLGAYLTAAYHLIAPDLPGFGESSSPPEADYGYEAQANRIDAFVNFLGFTKFHLVGSSMGGCIAAHYAAYHPERLLSLCLIAPAGVSSSGLSDLDIMLDTTDSNPLVPRFPKDYDRLLEFAFHKRPFIPYPLYRRLSHDIAKRHTLNHRIFQSIRAPLTRPLESLLDTLRVPTLIIWGNKDRILHVSGAEILGNAIPNAQVEIIKNVGHAPMIENPEVVARRYGRFLQGAHGNRLRAPAGPQHGG